MFGAQCVNVVVPDWCCSWYISVLYTNWHQILFYAEYSLVRILLAWKTNLWVFEHFMRIQTMMIHPTSIVAPSMSSFNGICNGRITQFGFESWWIIFSQNSTIYQRLIIDVPRFKLQHEAHFSAKKIKFSVNLNSLKETMDNFLLF